MSNETPSKSRRQESRFSFLLSSTSSEMSSREGSTRRSPEENQNTAIGMEGAGQPAGATSSVAAETDGEARANGMAARLFNGVERLLFGASPSTARSQPPTAHDASRYASRSDAQHGRDSSSRGASSPGAAVSSREPLSVVVEDPQIAWTKRHAHRLAALGAHPGGTISRFSQALALHDGGDSGDEHHATHPNTARRADANGFGGAEEDPIRGGLAVVELTSAIDAYQGSTNEYYGSLVQAALAQRGPNDPVRGEELIHAARNPYLIQCILASGTLDGNDPDVQQIIQDEIDWTIGPVGAEAEAAAAAACERSKRKCTLRVSPNHATYLKSLFQMPSSKITVEQVSVLENSGFEFVKLLHDYPHVLRGVPPTPWWQLKPYEEHRAIDLITALAGMLLILFDLGSISAIAIYWGLNTSRTNFGYWTILMALGGYVVSLIVVVVFESSKVDSSLYDERKWEYPSSNIKVLPLLPILELMLVVQIVRYYWASRREGRAYFVITHDLHASFAHLFILHSQCHSFPQILLQCYLFEWGSFGAGDDTFAPFRILLVTASISTIVSLLLFLRRVACFRSINGAGFSVFGSEPNATFDSRGDFFPKIITFLLIFMLEYNAFFLIVAITNLGECSTTVLVWIAIMGGILVAVVIILAYSLVKGKSSGTTGRLSLGPLLAQIGFAVYASVFSATDEGRPGNAASCAFYSITLGANVRVGIATFSVMISVWAAWMATTVWRRYQTMDRTMPLWKQFRYLMHIGGRHDGDVECRGSAVNNTRNDPVAMPEDEPLEQQRQPTADDDATPPNVGSNALPGLASPTTVVAGAAGPRQARRLVLG